MGPGSEAPKIRKYVVGFYREGPNRSQIPAEERPQLLSDHLAHLRRLRDSGDLIVYGPLEDSEIAGIVVFATESVEEARALLAHDPKLVRGDLRLDLREWYAAPGLTVV